MSDKAEIEKIRRRAEMAIEGGHEYVGFDPKAVLALLAALDAATAERREREEKLVAFVIAQLIHPDTANRPDFYITAFEKQEKANARLSQGVDQSNRDSADAAGR